MTDLNNYPRPDGNNFEATKQDPELTPYEQAMQSLNANAQGAQPGVMQRLDSKVNSGLLPQTGDAQAIPQAGGQVVPQAGSGQTNAQAPADTTTPVYAAGMPQVSQQTALGAPIRPDGQQIPTSLMHEPVPVTPVPFFKQDTLGSWLVVLLLNMVLPLVWVIFLAFSDVGSESKKQWARAILVMFGISFALVIVISLFMVTMLQGIIQ